MSEELRASPRWTRVAERGSIWGMRSVVWCYRVFGRPLSVLLVTFIVAYFYATGRSARAASRAYLRRVAAVPAGARTLGRKPDAWASFRHFLAFGISILDRLVIWMGRGDELGFETSGREHVQRLVRPDRGAIVVGAHLGSFDALRALADRDENVVNVLMYTRHAPRINALFRQLSPGAQMRVIQADAGTTEVVHQIRACIERGELVAMLGDRVEPNDRGRTTRVPLLGAPVELPEAPYLIAGLLRCPVFFMVALRGPRGGYRAWAEVLSERVDFAGGEREKTVRELAAAFAGRLEHYLLTAPYQWFNFYDYWEEGAR